jgi:hypothetical protein
VNSIVIDQAKIRVSDDIAARMKPGSEFPRSLAWWQRIVPCWLTATEDAKGHIVLTPNGYQADGNVYELTPALMRREMRHAQDWLFAWNKGHIDFTDAIAA